MSTTTIHIDIHAEDLYERLGVERTASRDEVRAAYRALLRRYPPERAPEEFKRIREAYEVLNDAASRAEYDRAPSAAVQRLLRLASAAMEAQRYPEAEQHLKQVLAEDPTLDYARNWLGLCFLYQEKPGHALPLFEQLLQREQPSPAWFGNAGHAYARLGRIADAESMFRRAVLAADAEGEDVTSYYVALADLYIDRKDLDAAEEVLEKAIRHDGTVDFEDLRYFTKLLEVQLVRNDPQRADAVLRRIRVVAVDEQQREYTAWKLGDLACQLLAAGAFTLAAAVARASGELQPQDGDYRSLAQVASLLSQKNHADAEQMLRTHRCFWGEGRLAGLNSTIRQHCSQLRVFGPMKPISSAPPLFTLNGFGTMLYGERDPDAQTRSHVATLYLVGIFIPVIPLACYRVIRDGDRSWRFLGKVPFSKANKIHLAASLVVIFFFVLAVALTPSTPSSSSYYSSGSSYGSDYGTSPQRPSALRDLSSSYSPGSTGSPSEEGEATGEQARIESERFRVRWMGSQVQTLQARQDSIGNAIDDLKSQISAIEGRATGGTIASGDYPRYRRLIERHNALIDRYNEVQSQVQRETAEYETALRALNSRIDRYNSAQ
ncbi:MAG TPA: DnaJ domain-containing protein [Longimicrobium sp.]